MKPVIGYIKEYYAQSDKRLLAIVTVFTAVLVFLNYNFGFDDWIDSRNSFVTSFIGRAIIFGLAFGVPWGLYVLVSPAKYNSRGLLIFLIVLAALLFSLKVSLNFSFRISDEYSINNYWNLVIYYPLLALIMFGMLAVIWKATGHSAPMYGLLAKGVNWKPYIIMLLIMLPLIALASTQPDFLAVYPKLKLVSNFSFDELSWWHKLLFELSYGSDFFTIELFFRGFLVLAFMKWGGKDVILPMACFYCTIHFGKPLGECISSYFGGMLLGIVVYHTRSILGGLVVHLGIAWLMELGGYIGNAVSNN